MSLKRQTTMNYFIIIYYDLFLNIELIRSHCSRHIRAWYQSINDFGKLSKINKDFFEKQSEQDQIFIWRFSAKTMSCFIRICKLPTVYDSTFFICFHDQARCKGYCRAQSQLNSFVIQITNRLWHRPILHLIPEPSEV